MRDGKRNYEAEKNWEKTKKPSRLKERTARHKARRQAGLKVGDPRQVDHIKPFAEGGSNSKSNTRVTSAKANLTKEAQRKKRAEKK